MATYNALNWQNENSLSNFPLSSYIEFRDFLVDARFVQFDNFTPVLNTITVDETSVTLTITFDYGTNSNIVLLKQTFLQNTNSTNIRIYTPSNNRYLGVISFGSGTLELFKTHVGRTLALDMAFSQDSVRSIPLNDAVYTLDGLYGDLVLGRGTADDSIFYNTSNSKKTIVFNAVKYHEIAGTNTKQGLRKINLVPPIDNNINLSPSEVIRATPNNGASLLLSLVSGSTNNAFQISKV
jgi:hypothetical protein